jgi:hypothetical protein
MGDAMKTITDRFRDRPLITVPLSSSKLQMLNHAPSCSSSFSHPVCGHEGVDASVSGEPSVFPMACPLTPMATSANIIDRVSGPGGKDRVSQTLSSVHIMHSVFTRVSVMCHYPSRGGALLLEDSSLAVEDFDLV